MIALPVLEKNSLGDKPTKTSRPIFTGGKNFMEGEATYSIIGVVIYFALLFGVMYLLFILPHRRREKKTRQMLEALRVGDEIVTVGGISGTVLSMKDDEITIETSIQKTKISIKKWAVKEVKELIKA